MRLSMMAVYEFLKNESCENCIRADHPDESLHLKRAVCYQKEKPQKDKDHVYIGMYQEMKDEIEKKNDFPGISILEKGIENVRTENAKNHNIIYLSDAGSFQDIFNKVQALFFYYQEWEKHLYEATLNHADIGTLCKMSSDVFENMIHVYDSSLFLLGSSNEKDDEVIWEEDKDTGRKVLSIDTINNFKYEKRFKETMSTQGVQLYEDDFSPGRVLYRNIWEEDQYAGRLCVSETKRNLLSAYFASGFRLSRYSSRQRSLS